MSPKSIMLVPFMLALATLAAATPTCPAECIQTVTVTVAPTSTESGSAATSSIVSYSNSTQTSTSGVAISTSGPYSNTTNTALYSNSTSTAPYGNSTSTVLPANGTAIAEPTATSELVCNHNNCLRHFLRHPEATPFCQTYTATINTATTGLPDVVSQCHNEPSRISAACSCLFTSASSAVATSSVASGSVITDASSLPASATAFPSSSAPYYSNGTASHTHHHNETASHTHTRHHNETASASATPYLNSTASASFTASSNLSIITSAPTTAISSTQTALPSFSVIASCHQDNCLRQFMQTPAVFDFCATYTTTVNTATTDLPSYVSMCTGTTALPTTDYSRISSACACFVPATAAPVSASATSSAVLSSSSETACSVVYETRYTTEIVTITGGALSASASATATV